jgi:glycosyltransferase involved in cell wall biosynthesis
MKRVCFNVQPLIGSRSGIGWYTYNIINHIDQKDIRVEGMCFDFLGKNHAREKFADVKTDNLYINKFIPSKVYKLLTGYLPIHYDCFFPKGDIYHFFNFVAPSISKKKKVIITIHDMVYKVMPETVSAKTLYILNRDLERSIKRANAIITVSEHSKRDLMKYHQVDEEKISIVNPGIDYPFFEKGQSMDHGTINRVKEKYALPDKYILYLGTLEPRKNIGSIIDAYELLSEEIKSEYKLVLAGRVGWKANEILKKIENTPSADNIVRVGYVDEVDKPFIYGIAHAFVFPSLYEGFGMPVVEAMACGTAVVTSNNSSLPEAGGEAALYSDALDAKAISENIRHLLLDEVVRDQLVQKGIQHAKTFSWKDSADMTVKVYQKLLGES